MFTLSRSLVLFSNFPVALIISAATIVTSVVMSLSNAFNRFCTNTYFSNFHDENLLTSADIGLSLNHSGFVLRSQLLFRFKYACQDTTGLAPKAIYVFKLNSQA